MCELTCTSTCRKRVGGGKIERVCERGDGCVCERGENACQRECVCVCERERMSKCV